MASKRINVSDREISTLSVPDKGHKIYYGITDIAGLGLRVTAAGSRTFILNYRTRGGVERRYTIGDAKVWKVAVAREEAKRLRQLVDAGGDPLHEERTTRDSETVADLCERFKGEFLPRKRAKTQSDYVSMIERDILPAIGKLKVEDVTYDDIDGLHRKISFGTKKRRAAPYRANRVVALLSKMFNLAINQWKVRSVANGNPAKGIERNPEEPRERYLSDGPNGELERLAKALAETEHQQGADIIRLILLTGARLGEVLNAKWSQFDLENGTWTKRSGETKQVKLHVVPLSPPAHELLKRVYAEARDEKGKLASEWVFPGNGCKPHVDLKWCWDAIMAAAEITNFRRHDLRHTFGSYLAMANMQTPIIQKLMGHAKIATTQRYMHLALDSLRVGADHMGNVVTGVQFGKKSA